MENRNFREILEATMREAANDNLDAKDAADMIVTDLAVAGFGIKRNHDVVNYHLPVIVLHQPVRGSGESFGGHPVMEVPSADDLNGQSGWLVSWTEHGRTKCAWFDIEGTCPKQPHYRVINPKTPCAGAIAARAAYGEVA